MNYIIGIDGGTTKIKAVLFDTTGHEIETVAAPSDLLEDGVRKELDMAFFWEKTAACVRLLMEKGPAEPGDILAIGVTGQGEGLWALDKNNRPVGNAILWNDGRAHEEDWAVNEKTPGIGKLVHRNLGTPVGAGSALLLLKWVKANQPDRYQRIQTVFFAKDWLRYCMTDRIATDRTDGGAAYLRLIDGAPAKQALTVLSLPEVENGIPEILPSDLVAGALAPAAAEKMGLQPGIPVATGVMDVVASAVGTGAVGSGDAAVVLGTTCAVERVLRLRDCDVTRCRRHYLHHVRQDLAIDLSSTINGMENVEWMMREIARSANYRVVEGLIEDTRPGSGGVVYHPYLSAAGERAPFQHRDASASFFGVNARTTKGDLMRAVYEGLAFSVRDCLEGGDYRGRLLLSGGGAASATLSQMIADVTGQSVVVTKGSEFGALGAAMTAGTAIGLFENVEDAAARCCRLKKIYKPRKNEMYEKCYTFYRELRTAFGPLWERRAEIFGR
ncbi:FGGY-family carbohydrate kinase [Eubacterium sp. 1001713B170207_170306_E7]|uniref:FGGY-family carbohydrate kinase n=1 Tax=Eubacterium sp. 1001713B170207_170306_E7 TaxID=2787097 RepID=UPI0018996350|nr:FGGY-family carbohydrate kinase [Eubacterium sp. 1001713B170207_170306_E7]